jgi:hypothetical protein
LAISTVSALKYYHSLLPPPTVSINVTHIYPNHFVSSDNLHFATNTECYSRSTPEIATLCTQAMTATRAANTNLSLVQLLNLIDNITAAQLETSQPQHVLTRSQHAARMAELWQITTQLLRFVDLTADGEQFDRMTVFTAFQLDRRFCEALGDNRAILEVLGFWRNSGVVGSL